jgi:hypothetical protein
MQVEYRRLKTFGNYENETIGAVVEVPRGQDPDAILSALKEWVDARLNMVLMRKLRIEREKREAEQRRGLSEQTKDSLRSIVAIPF